MTLRRGNLCYMIDGIGAADVSIKLLDNILNTFMIILLQPQDVTQWEAQPSLGLLKNYLGGNNGHSLIIRILNGFQKGCNQSYRPGKKEAEENL